MECNENQLDLSGIEVKGGEPVPKTERERRINGILFLVFDPGSF